MTPETALAIWERAAEEEIGLILTLECIEDKRRVEKALYDARRDSPNPKIEELMIARPGDAPNELWILRKTTDMRDVV